MSQLAALDNSSRFIFYLRIAFTNTKILHWKKNEFVLFQILNDKII